MTTLVPPGYERAESGLSTVALMREAGTREGSWDVVVVGGGHAGVEAAAAAARMGARTLLLTMNLDTIGKMSCNPAVGGLAKGQIVREVDALGGVMPRVADRAAIQFRLLNRSRGPAVRAPRAQCDKKLYQFTVKQVLEGLENLELGQERVAGVRVEGDRVAGVVCGGGARYDAKAVVLAPGTFLSGVLHTGDETVPGGRGGEPPAEGLSDSLRELTFRVERLKTDTSPRLNGRSIDFSKLEAQHGDAEPVFFSFSTRGVAQPQRPCHITFTNERTHGIIRAALDRSPLYDGRIETWGPRYCPSIEIKVVRFEEKPRHQLFLEPEGLATREVYVNGATTSLPREVQREMIHSCEGLERAEIMRYGYAVEYDAVDPTQVASTLETKLVEGLFHAGQINGTSGYEEAAGQGILAGINAALRARGEGGISLGRDEAYIGVMVDDLVTRGVDEPYRMFTSRAEFRLLLRYDNADLRLMPPARRLGLLDDEVWRDFEEKREQIGAVKRFLSRTHSGGATLRKLLSRPEVTAGDLAGEFPGLRRFRADALSVAENDVKYAGYVERQRGNVDRLRRREGKKLPADADYSEIRELRIEAREKLEKHRPETLGQAARIPGVNPADVSILLMYLQRGVPRRRTRV